MSQHRELANPFACAVVLEQVKAARTALPDSPAIADGTGSTTMPLLMFDPLLTAGAAVDRAREWVDVAGEEDCVTSRDLLLEPVLSALAADDAAALRTALIRTAAFAVQWTERIDQRTRAQKEQHA